MTPGWVQPIALAGKSLPAPGCGAAVRGPGPSTRNCPAVLLSRLLGLFPAQHPLARAAGTRLSPAGGEVSGEAGSKVPGGSLVDGRHLASGSGLAALAAFHFSPLKLPVRFLAASLQTGPCPPRRSTAGDPAVCRGGGSEQGPAYGEQSLALALNPLVGFFPADSVHRDGQGPSAGEGKKWVTGHRLQMGQGELWGSLQWSQSWGCGQSPQLEGALGERKGRSDPSAPRNPSPGACRRA